MALEQTFRELAASLHYLCDSLNVLEVAFGDKPVHDESAVADAVEVITLEILGKLHEARQSAANARRAVGHPVDLEKASRELMRCQESFLQIEERFASGLVSYEQLKELARLGSTRKLWQPWSNLVRQEIEQCQPHLRQASKALASCWQELLEHSGSTSISIRTENLGQKIISKRSAEHEIQTSH